MDNLKPCPFCGCGEGNLYIVTIEQRGFETLGIFCNGCKQTTILEENEWEGDTALARKRAIDAWNSRIKQRIIMDELKPCPFCGKSHIVVDSYESQSRPECKWLCRVFCADCFSSASNHGFDWTEDEAKEKAIKAWNRRVGEQDDCQRNS